MTTTLRVFIGIVALLVFTISAFAQCPTPGVPPQPGVPVMVDGGTGPCDAPNLSLNGGSVLHLTGRFALHGDAAAVTVPFTNGQFLQHIGGANAQTIDYQGTMNILPHNIKGVYNTQFGGYQVFQNSSQVEQLGTGVAVAQFGEAITTGPGLGWAGNYVAYANNIHGTPFGVEIDYGSLVAGHVGGGAGLTINASGPYSASGPGLQFGHLTHGVHLSDAIQIWNFAPGDTPVSGYAIRAWNVEMTGGIDMHDHVTLGGPFLRGPNDSFVVDSAGNITARSITLTESGSGGNTPVAPTSLSVSGQTGNGGTVTYVFSVNKSGQLVVTGPSGKSVVISAQ